MKEYDFQSKHNSFVPKPVNFRVSFDKYLYHWKWFVLIIFLGLSMAFLFLRYTPDEYFVSTTILINDEENGIVSSELSAFEDLGIISNQKTSLETEITVLKSRTLIQNTIKNLGFNISYEHQGRVSNREIYFKNMPFKVNFLKKDSLFYKMDTSFIISSDNNKTYVLRNSDGQIVQESGFGEVINSRFGELIITPNQIDGFNILGDQIRVIINPLKAVSDHYRDKIVIAPASKKSNGLVLSLNDELKFKAQDILNEFVKEYNMDGINDKNEIAKNTDEFISQRIRDISKELESVDRGVEDFKTDNLLTDINKEAGLVLESNSEIEKRIIDITSQIRLIDFVSEYMSENKNDLIPANLGLRDETTSQSTVTYNQLLLERNRIIKGSSQMNPTVVNLETQIATLRESIDRSLVNLRKSLSFALNEARIQESKLKAKRAQAPRQEREFQDIKRKQQIIETLYLYLLQKREENAIKLTVIEPSAKVLDVADGANIPVYPKQGVAYIIGVLLGLIVPFMTIYFRNLLDNKIHTFEDVEEEMKVPILGDIPSATSKENVILSPNDTSNIAEAFRLLRTNVNFMFSGEKDKSKTIFITSSIGGEGKTIVAINLAISLSYLNKKVLLIGADIRKPKISKYLNIDKKDGLTNYLVDSKLKVDSIISSTDFPYLDIIQSGVIPPNPSELLSNGRFEEVLVFGQKNYDYVIVDTAPINIVTDTLQFSHLADLFVYVIRANYTDKRMLKPIKTLYENKRLPNMSLLINDTNFKKKGYGYEYGYHEEKSKTFWWKKTD